MAVGPISREARLAQLTPTKAKGNMSMLFNKVTGGIVAIGMVLAACASPGNSIAPSGSQPAASAGGNVDQVLRVNMSQEPPHLDPTQADDSISIQVLRSITSPLAYYDADLQVVPALAASWEFSADGKTLTWHLGDHKYSNGDPIVAADFVTSYRRLADPRIAASYSYSLEPVVGWSELQDVDTATASDTDVEVLLDKLGVAAPDDKTFVVTLKRPATYFVYIGAGWFSAPQKAEFAFGEADGYVSSGPMMMKEWRHNSNIVLIPNPEWDGTPVTIDEIDLAMINDQTASLAAYEADEIDLSGIPRAEINRVKDDPDLSGQIIEGNVLSFNYYGFDLKNKNGPFTKSVLLRKAFNEALDKDTMLATVFSGIGNVAYSLVPIGMPGHQDDQFIKFDVAQAKTDFDEAVAALGVTKDQLNLEIGFNSAGGANDDLAAFMQQQWETAFGIKIQLTSMGDFGSYLDRLTQDPFDIFRLGWGADYPHPNNFLTDLISCTSGNNNMGYCNPAVDALLEEAASKATLEEQIPLYNQAQELVMADAPVIPQTFGARFSLVKPWVQGLVVTAQDSNAGELFYAWTSITPH
jgi:oligopeptide transport system substrate-binding protein